tara:strand:+ start:2433 stop:3485 length:1053 start_codon:yes stop_codon:yes gene_type:complete
MSNPLFEWDKVSEATPPKAALVSAKTQGLSDHDDDYVLRIDNSTLEKFQSCPRSADFYAIRRKTSPPSGPLLAGGALHSGMEYLYKNGVSPEHLPMAQQIAEEFFAEQPNVDTQWRNPSLVCAALEKYVKNYENNDPFELVQYKGEPFVERSFEIELGVIDVNTTLPYNKLYLCNEGEDAPLYVRKLYCMWTGKLDLAVRDAIGVKVLDHKTTSMLGSTFYKQFEIGQQPLGYSWALQKILGETVSGFIVNAIYWRPPLKNQTNGRVEFYRHPFNYSQELIAEWETDVMGSVSDFVSNMIRGHFPGYRLWCVGKYGVCPYHDVCTLGKSQRSALLNSSLYDNVNWDPTKS